MIHACRYKYTVCPYKEAKQDHTRLGCVLACWRACERLCEHTVRRWAVCNCRDAGQLAVHAL